jgi:hypothetical protein
MAQIRTEDVFGVSSKEVLSYVTRDSVDDRFVEAIKSDKQIVVYGSSKQGKTALVSKHLPYDKNIVVRLTPKTEVVDIYNAILRKLDIRLQTVESTMSETEAKVGFGAKVKALIPFLGSGEATANGELVNTNGRETEYEEVPINLNLPEDVAGPLSR